MLQLPQLDEWHTLCGDLLWRPPGMSKAGHFAFQWPDLQAMEYHEVVSWHTRLLKKMREANEHKPGGTGTKARPPRRGRRRGRR